MKCLVVMGTRPEVIKLAPVIWALRDRGHDPIVCLTGQHRELLDGALATFGLTGDYDLDVMTEDQTPNDVLALVLRGMCPVLKETDPDWVVVEGDTTSVVGAAMAAFHAMTPVCHVEAGLRSFDRWAPFPEEINRRLVSVLASLHCAPTPESAGNLYSEGIPRARIVVTGNTVVDAIRWAVQQPPAVPPPDGPVVTITAHRRENHARLPVIAKAVHLLAMAYPKVLFVWPLHPNPAVRKCVDIGGHNIRLIEPLDYVSMAWLIAASRLVLTDSGGLQEEAPSLGVPVLVMRDVTERPEGIAMNVARLVGTDINGIFAAAAAVLDGTASWFRANRDVYGDGRAGERIVAALEDRARLSTEPVA